MGTRIGVRAIVGAVLASFFSLPMTPIAVAQERPADLTAFEVRSTYTAKFGFSRPVGITLTPNGDLLVLDANAPRGRGLQLTRAGRSEGSIATGVITRPSTIAFDARSDSLTAIADDRLLTIMDAGQTGRLRAQAPVLRSAVDVAIDPATGAVYVLSDDRRSIDRWDPSAGPRGVAERILTAGPIASIALNPYDGLLYAASGSTLIVIDDSGATQSTYNLAGLDLEIADMTFAPSADATDDPSINNLFVADTGVGAESGRMVEVSLVEPMALDPMALGLAATTEIATLVQVIDTSLWVPASPDPSGITYLPFDDLFQVADSEVDEYTPGGVVNLWRVNRMGVVQDTGTLLPDVSDEPTGLGSRSDTNVLFVSDDDAGRIHIIQAGTDTRFGTSDDSVRFINAGAYDSDDPEDPEYHTASGHLFFVDGVNREIYDIDPVDGVFGNSNDVMTHFDISTYGNDFEALSSDPARGTLILGARSTKTIFEITPSGQLVRTIDARGISGLTYLSGLATGPSSDESGRTTYWIVDRAIDNSDPGSIDGKMFEIAIPPPAPGSDTAPEAFIDKPAANSTIVGSTEIMATAVDDKSVVSVAFQIDGSTIATDTNGANGWRANWPTTNFPDGNHTIRVVATDTSGNTATASRTVIVDNIDELPTVALANPPATVGGSYQIAATASDDRGVASVTFSIDGLTIGRDTNPAGGWTIAWDTTTVADGSHTMGAIATDTVGQTATASRTVIVDNIDEPPTVALANPPATVGGSYQIAATATDDRGLASVTFSIDGLTIGTDTSPAGGWTIAWDTTTVADGSHTMGAIATDTVGQTATASRNVTIANIDPVEFPSDFVDSVGSVFADDIRWLKETGVGRGCNPPSNDRFCPDDLVTRGQMAAFLVRAFGFPAGVAQFGDVGGTVFANDIARLASAEITLGCNPPANNRFCPDDPVTRGQMAAFLARALDLPAGAAEFGDVDGTVFADDIARLASAEITLGCNPPINNRFCPNDGVTRGQMAAFLHRTVDYTG